MTTVGVLALQGDVREHAAAVTRLGATATLVRRARELDAVDAIILPGGESTTIDKLLRAFELREPLIERIEAGLPVLGSCAGMILLATDLVDGIAGQQTLGAIPMTVRRNAFGRQVDSAEASLTWLPDGSPMNATFIRAPWVESCGEGVDVLATAVAADGVEHAVAVQHGARLATAFHPEISDEPRVHQRLLDLVS